MSSTTILDPSGAGAYASAPTSCVIPRRWKRRLRRPRSRNFRKGAEFQPPAVTTGRISIGCTGAGLLLALTLLALPAAAEADRTIATLSAPAPVSAFAGRLAWSAYDPASRSYRLMTEAGGTVSAVPVAGRTVPFDVDLGPDRNGNAIAAYSRCRREPVRSDPAISNAIVQMPNWSSGRGCDLYRFDFATGRETRIASADTRGASEFLPSVWRTRVAFARVYERRAGRAGDRAYLYVRSLAGAGRARRVPAGSRSTLRFCSRNPRRCRLKLEPGPTALDLAGRRLAFGWDSGGEIGPTSATYLATLGSASVRKKLLSRESSGDIQGSEIVSPVVAAGQVVWMLTLFGDETANRSRRYGIASGETTEAPIPPPPGDIYLRPALASTVDGESVVYLASGLAPLGEPCTVESRCIANPGCSVAQPCELRGVERLPYARPTG
jgi:hypothetical protein